MTDVLEQRVSNTERNIERISEKLDRVGEKLDRSSEQLVQLGALVAQTTQESNERFARSDERLTRLEALVAQSAKENQEGIKKLRIEMGNMSRRLGTLVEDLVAPSLPRILRNVVPCPEDDEVLVNVRQNRRHPTQKGRKLEIDAIADCGNYALFNETKSQLTPEKVKEFLDKLAIVREYFPEYQHHQIIGCVASLKIDTSLIHYANRQGLLVLAIGDELMGLQNEPDFSWRAF